ncbi:hypothetical protein ACQCQ6_02955 [Ralstonia pseudosolanacearum]|uniref:hypothetical protein n=1 Tax=Ralstonia pseudosolanacearum TaxID=1310165 RepID=UPI002675AF1D|nr:hypothetical protein [Ralstonia pseudosolanacearum]MDO3519098.1 hypothetical protein [Ralstonia pseudosolanacearum]MDO3542993.1 hypothetical protein [Ralstonia pseudosolanacearum]
MPRPGRKGRSNELLNRSGDIKQVHASIGIRADKPRSLPPERKAMLTIDIEGELTEPVAGTSQFSIMAYVSENPVVGTREVPSIGAFIAIKPVLQGVIDLSQSEFQSLLSMASTGMLRSCYFAFTKPRYRSAKIVTADFSSRAADELDE